MRKRTINNMHGGYRAATLKTYLGKPEEEKKEEPTTIIKEVIKKEKDTGTLIGATTGAAIGSLLVGAIGGIAAYRKYQNQPAQQGVGYGGEEPVGVVELVA